MNDRAAVKGLLVALIVTIGIIVAMVATILCRLGKQPMPDAIMKGGAAFAGSVGLMVLVLATLGLI
jgi:pantoate kinase